MVQSTGSQIIRLDLVTEHQQKVRDYIILVSTMFIQ